MTTGTAARPVDLVLQRYRRHLSAGRASLAELTGSAMEVASCGSRVYDSDGTVYLDCGGYGVFLLGHRHPAVVQAVVDQIHRHPMATRLLLEPVAAEAAGALVAVAPAGLTKVHFVNSGAEATETAIKLARLHGKTRLISAVGGFHGKTMGALSLTARTLYQDPFRPLLGDVEHVQFGDLQSLSAVLQNSSGRACLVLEPVQGEGGVRLPPDGYLRGVAELCHRYEALFVLDEIQTGLGRLGHWWGADREQVSPDMLLVGKNLSGGVIPVAAVLSTEAVYEPLNRDPFLHSSTFAASPVAMAAARAAVETIHTDQLVDRAAELGRRLRDGLQSAVARHGPGLACEIRGAGLLIGVELPDGGTAGRLVLALMDRHVLVNHSLNDSRVVRFTPPAVLTDQELDWAVDAFADAIRDLAHAPH